MARIDVNANLLEAIADGQSDLKIKDIVVSLISVFELQAKAAKLKIPSKFTIEAIEIILHGLKVEPFHNPQIIEISSYLRTTIPDYIDCIIVATAASLNEDLTTEDSIILHKKKQ